MCILVLGTAPIFKHKFNILKVHSPVYYKDRVISIFQEDISYIRQPKLQALDTASHSIQSCLSLSVEVIVSNQSRGA